MSRPIQENIPCPGCNQASPFTMWASLNVTLDPDKKPLLIDGELFRFRCPHCGAVTQVAYPMLYHDMERQFMIWMAPPDDSGNAAGPAEAGFKSQGQMTGYTFRAVHSINELLEKILIFDAKLDDLVIEMVKMVILTQMPQADQSEETEVHFAQLEDNGAEGQELVFAIVKPAETTGATLPREPVYTDMAKAVAELKSRKSPPPGGQWPHIDAAYLMDLMDLSENAPPAQSPAPPPDEQKPW
ncbi:MAG: hypothetical protein QOE14_1049, partial [Humisphaera sp.]|nr:hypothetical protein [Humisphaera sp.]